MVSIIIKQALERENKINCVIETLKENPEQDLKKLIFEISMKLNCSLSKAKEYLEIAKWKIEEEKNVI